MVLHSAERRDLSSHAAWIRKELAAMILKWYTGQKERHQQVTVCYYHHHNHHHLSLPSSQPPPSVTIIITTTYQMSLQSSQPPQGITHDWSSGQGEWYITNLETTLNRQVMQSNSFLSMGYGETAVISARGRCVQSSFQCYSVHCCCWIQLEKGSPYMDDLSTSILGSFNTSADNTQGNI